MNNKQAAVQIPPEICELRELIEKVDKAKPDRRDIVAIDHWIESHPKLFDEIWNLSRIAQNHVIELFSDKELGRIFIRSELGLLAKNLGDVGRPTLEHLLIQNILANWLHWQWVQLHLANLMGGSRIDRSNFEFWEKQASVVQHRYLRASETLAWVRKLARKSPALQVNIATERGQQVNIAGEFVNQDSENS